ncbi:efflux RND transporter periplasmic adaptor subunit [Aliidiomarina quisquiliarum]|uniref:efflux RND transporter periplasmic adaptor subunit n=1 Tax=Aliidiomarina quisquiliarum TaxID=2938947 RepID=UPI00208E93E1|nr:efflux RND transporter periplasmic adaptor subunit [Aliidiomarina quisquiliarum]MCO4320088.1 efflux RND transporter periplasmic adaptor subunit [Aliidiomarina quisquiliarum]
MPKQRIILFALALVGLILVFTFLAGSWSSKVGEAIAPSEQQQPAAVATAMMLTTADTRRFSGQIQPRRQSSVSARITARVADVLVESGDQVQEGDVLLRLDNDDLSARVRQQQQSLAAAQARANEARSSFQRVSALVEQGLLPSASLDEATAQRDTAEAQLIGAREALSEAKTSESYSVIVAPFSGVVSDRTVFTGDIATPGMPLVSLYQPESLRFEAAVSESVLRFVEPNKAFMVEIDAQDKTYPAVVTEIVPTADAASRSFKVRLALETTTPLNPGMYGRLTVPTGERDMVVVPVQSIESLGQLDYVFVAVDQRIERRLVRLGDTKVVNGGYEWIEVHSGISAGEVVVMQGEQ